MATVREFFPHSSVLAQLKRREISCRERLILLKFLDHLSNNGMKARVTTQTEKAFKEKFNSPEKAKEFFLRLDAYIDRMEDDSERDEMNSMVFHALKLRDAQYVYLVVLNDEQKEMITTLFQPDAYPKILVKTILEIESYLDSNE